MHKNCINLKNFSHKLVIIFLEDGKMASHMSFMFLGNGKMALDTWGLHHGRSIPATTWSLQRVSQMEHTDMLHGVYRLTIAIC
jgi:hypothetical protein